MVLSTPAKDANVRSPSKPTSWNRSELVETRPQIRLERNEKDKPRTQVSFHYSEFSVMDVHCNSIVVDSEVFFNLVLSEQTPNIFVLSFSQHVLQELFLFFP